MTRRLLFTRRNSLHRRRARRVRPEQRRSATASCSGAVWASPDCWRSWRSRDCSPASVYLQVVQHEHYQTLAETNRIAIVPIVPNRGVITDRNGVVLAQSYSAYTLEIMPSKVKNLDETIDAICRAGRGPRRATASASASSSTSRRTSRACRSARA